MDVLQHLYFYCSEDCPTKNDPYRGEESLPKMDAKTSDEDFHNAYIAFDEKVEKFIAKVETLGVDRFVDLFCDLYGDKIRTMEAFGYGESRSITKKFLKYYTRKTRKLNKNILRRFTEGVLNPSQRKIVKIYKKNLKSEVISEHPAINFTQIYGTNMEKFQEKITEYSNRKMGQINRKTLKKFAPRFSVRNLCSSIARVDEDSKLLDYILSIFVKDV